MDPSNRTILLVNDDPEWCELFTKVFEEAGFQALAVSGLAGTTNALADQQIGVAVIDLMLPNREGFGVLEAVKRIAGASTLVVMVAGYAEASDWAEAKAHGADGLMVMPYTVEDLVESVARLRSNQAASRVEDA